MTLEEAIQEGIDAGARWFVLEDFSEGEGPPEWHWEIGSKDPVRWFYLPKPSDFWFEWLGFGIDREKPLGFLPFRLDWCRSLKVGVHVGCERAGWQGVMPLSIEDGLRHAVRAYVCEFDAATCAHSTCPDRNECHWREGDWL